MRILFAVVLSYLFGSIPWALIVGKVFYHKDIRKGDVLLMQIASPVPNHAAIYLDDGVIMQHVAGRLSSRDVYGGYWAKHTTHVLRHRSLL